MATARKAYEPGRVIRLSKASVSAGDLVAEGQLHGVATRDTDADGYTDIDTAGVYNLPVKGHDGSANGAVAVGDLVYLTDGEAFCDIDSAQVQFGIALGAVGSGNTTTVPVLITSA